jgi:DNA-directed RNA polymerase
VKLTNAALAELGVGRTRDPVGTFDDWRKADKPFLFVRSCLELYEAWRDPDFRTVLPIGLDATASGLQHLSLLCLDGAAGQLVNLTNQHYNVIDVYSEVAGQVLATLKNDRHEWAHWWLERLEKPVSKTKAQVVQVPGDDFQLRGRESRLGCSD